MKIKLTQPYTAAEIEKITGSYPSPDIPKDSTVRFIATHSDEVEQDTLFLAFDGAHTSGVCFHREILRRGGYIMAKEKLSKGFSVPSVTDALYRLADAHLLSLKYLKHTVCITGSVGKTTTKEILARILSHGFSVHATAGNQNSEIGLPLTVLSAPADTELLLLEAGMNHAGELARISHLIHPSLIIITNIGYAHIGNLGSREKIAAAKKEILLGARADAITLVPQNEPLLEGIKSAKGIGILHEGDYAIKSEDGRMKFFEGDQMLFAYPSDIQDPAMLSAGAFSAAAALFLGISPHIIKDEILKFKNNIFRQNVLFVNGIEIIFDAYNASFESVLNAISLLCTKAATTRALVLGDMQELGTYTDALNERLAYAIAQKAAKIDLLFLFGENAQAVADFAVEAGFPPTRIFINSHTERPQDTATQILERKKDGMCVIIKGARGMRMERILHFLTNTKGGIA